MSATAGTERQHQAYLALCAALYGQAVSLSTAETTVAIVLRCGPDGLLDPRVLFRTLFMFGALRTCKQRNEYWKLWTCFTTSAAGWARADWLETLGMPASDLHKDASADDIPDEVVHLVGCVTADSSANARLVYADVVARLGRRPSLRGALLASWILVVLQHVDSRALAAQRGHWLLSVEVLMDALLFHVASVSQAKQLHPAPTVVTDAADIQPVFMHVTRVLDGLSLEDKKKVKLRCIRFPQSPHVYLGPPFDVSPWRLSPGSYDMLRAILESELRDVMLVGDEVLSDVVDDFTGPTNQSHPFDTTEATAVVKTLTATPPRVRSVLAAVAVGVAKLRAVTDGGPVEAREAEIVVKGACSVSLLRTVLVECGNFDVVYCACHTFVLDVSAHWPSKSLAVIAEQFVIPDGAQTPIVLDASGRDAPVQGEAKFGNPGTPGAPGMSGGHMTLNGRNLRTLIERGVLEVKSTGGAGGNGQSGYTGTNGKKGKNGKNAVIPPDADALRTSLNSALFVVFGDKADEPAGDGTPGGPYGQGGYGGLGGAVVLRDVVHGEVALSPSWFAAGSTGPDGKPGRGGLPGEGGLPGMDAQRLHKVHYIFPSEFLPTSGPKVGFLSRTRSELLADGFSQHGRVLMKQSGFRKQIHNLEREQNGADLHRLLYKKGDEGVNRIGNPTPPAVIATISTARLQAFVGLAAEKLQLSSFLMSKLSASLVAATKAKINIIAAHAELTKIHRGPREVLCEANFSYLVPFDAAEDAAARMPLIIAHNRTLDDLVRSASSAELCVPNLTKVLQCERLWTEGVVIETAAINAIQWFADHAPVHVLVDIHYTLAGSHQHPRVRRIILSSLVARVPQPQQQHMFFRHSALLREHLDAASAADAKNLEKHENDAQQALWSEAVQAMCSQKAALDTPLITYLCAHADRLDVNTMRSVLSSHMKEPLLQMLMCCLPTTHGNGHAPPSATMSFSSGGAISQLAEFFDVCIENNILHHALSGIPKTVSIYLAVKPDEPVVPSEVLRRDILRSHIFLAHSFENVYLGGQSRDSLCYTLLTMCVSTQYAIFKAGTFQYAPAILHRMSQTIPGALHSQAGRAKDALLHMCSLHYSHDGMGGNTNQFVKPMTILFPGWDPHSSLKQLANDRGIVLARWTKSLEDLSNSLAQLKSTSITLLGQQAKGMCFSACVEPTLAVAALIVVGDLTAVQKKKYRREYDLLVQFTRFCIAVEVLRRVGRMRHAKLLRMCGALTPTSQWTDATVAQTVMECSEEAGDLQRQGPNSLVGNMHTNDDHPLMDLLQQTFPELTGPDASECFDAACAVPRSVALVAASRLAWHFTCCQRDEPIVWPHVRFICSVMARHPPEVTIPLLRQHEVVAWASALMELDFNTCCSPECVPEEWRGPAHIASVRSACAEMRGVIARVGWHGYDANVRHFREARATSTTAQEFLTKLRTLSSGMSIEPAGSYNPVAEDIFPNDQLRVLMVSKIGKSQKTIASLNSVRSSIDAIKKKLRHNLRPTAGDPHGLSAAMGRLAASNDELSVLLSAVCAAWRLSTTQVVNDVQIAIVLKMILLRGSCLAQVRSGEGKTLILALLAAVYATVGYAVHIATLTPELARLGHTETHAFFDACTGQDGSSACCSTDGFDGDHAFVGHVSVVYGDPSSYMRHALDDSGRSNNFKSQRTSKHRFLLVDEADAVMMDHFSDVLYLSQEIPNMKTILHAYVSIWQWTAADDARSVDREVLARIVEDRLKVACGGGRLSVEAAFVQHMVPHWIDAAIFARELQENIHYRIMIPQDGGMTAATIVPYELSSGSEKKNTTWQDGLTQFLCIKHGLRLQPESPYSVFQSQRMFVREYGRDVCGMTGTLGPQSTQDTMRTMYNIDHVVHFPPASRCQFRSTPDALCRNRAEWQARIVSEALERSKAQPVLVIVQNIADADALVAAFKSEEQRHGARPLTISRYAVDGETLPHETCKGHIVVSTNRGGRGTNIPLSAESRRSLGLHVIVTNITSIIELDQAKARCARHGDPGSGQCVLLVPRGSSIDSTSAAIVQAERQQAADLVHRMTVLRTGIDCEDKLAERFRAFLQSVDTSLESRCVLFGVAVQQNQTFGTRQVVARFLQARFGVFLVEQRPEMKRIQIRREQSNMENLISAFKSAFCLPTADTSVEDIVDDPIYLAQLADVLGHLPNVRRQCFERACSVATVPCGSFLELAAIYCSSGDAKSAIHLLRVFRFLCELWKQRVDCAQGSLSSDSLLRHQLKGQTAVLAAHVAAVSALIGLPLVPSKFDELGIDEELRKRLIKASGGDAYLQVAEVLHEPSLRIALRNAGVTASEEATVLLKHLFENCGKRFDVAALPVLGKEEVWGRLRDAGAVNFLGALNLDKWCSVASSSDSRWKVVVELVGDTIEHLIKSGTQRITLEHLQLSERAVRAKLLEDVLIDCGALVGPPLRAAEREGVLRGLSKEKAANALLFFQEVTENGAGVSLIRQKVSDYLAFHHHHTEHAEVDFFETVGLDSVLILSPRASTWDVFVWCSLFALVVAQFIAAACLWSVPVVGQTLAAGAVNDMCFLLSSAIKGKPLRWRDYAKQKLVFHASFAAANGIGTLISSTPWASKLASSVLSRCPKFVSTRCVSHLFAADTHVSMSIGTTIANTALLSRSLHEVAGDVCKKSVHFIVSAKLDQRLRETLTSSVTYLLAYQEPQAVVERIARLAAQPLETAGRRTALASIAKIGKLGMSSVAHVADVLWRISSDVWDHVMTPINNLKNATEAEVRLVRDHMSSGVRREPSVGEAADVVDQLLGMMHTRCMCAVSTSLLQYALHQASVPAPDAEHSGELGTATGNALVSARRVLLPSSLPQPGMGAFTKPLPGRMMLDVMLDVSRTFMISDGEVTVDVYEDETHTHIFMDLSQLPTAAAPSPVLIAKELESVWANIRTQFRFSDAHPTLIRTSTNSALVDAVSGFVPSYLVVRESAEFSLACRRPTLQHTTILRRHEQYVRSIMTLYRLMDDKRDALRICGAVVAHVNKENSTTTTASIVEALSFSDCQHAGGDPQSCHIAALMLR